MDILTRDPAFGAMTFMVIDFEGTTPAGYRPEPIEVAALWLHVHDGNLSPDGCTFQALIRPPAHAPVTPSGARQTGITAAMTRYQPDASEVLARLDAIAGVFPPVAEVWPGPDCGIGAGACSGKLAYPHRPAPGRRLPGQSGATHPGIPVPLTLQPWPVTVGPARRA
jgi:hypothetical protein